MMHRKRPQLKQTLRLHKHKSPNIIPQQASKNAHSTLVARRFIHTLRINLFRVMVGVNGNHKAALLWYWMEIRVDDALVCSQKDITVNARWKLFQVPEGLEMAVSYSKQLDCDNGLCASEIRTF